MHKKYSVLSAVSPSGQEPAVFVVLKSAMQDLGGGGGRGGCKQSKFVENPCFFIPDVVTGRKGLWHMALAHSNVCCNGTQTEWLP